MHSGVEDIIITGATGFIGSEIVRHLLLLPDEGKIHLLIRPKFSKTAEQRFAGVVDYWKKHFSYDVAKNLQRLNIISCDLENAKTIPEIASAIFF